jgi:hypothetical protein
LNNKELEQFERESVDCILTTIIDKYALPSIIDLSDCIELLKPYAFGFFICNGERVKVIRERLNTVNVDTDFCLYNWYDLKIIRFMKTGEPEEHIKPEKPTLEDAFKQANDPYYYWKDKTKIEIKAFDFDIEEQFFKARIPEKVKQTYPDFNIESKNELLRILIETCTNERHLVFDPYNENSEVYQATKETNRNFIGFNLYEKDKPKEQNNQSDINDWF